MSESPLPYTVARRRHPASIDEDRDQLNLSTSSRAPPQSFPDHDDKKNQHSYSFSSLSSLIAPTAAQFWNSAQNTLAAVQQTDPLIRHNNSWGSNLDTASTQPIVPLTYEMPCRDRTNEFRTSAKSIQMKSQANGYVKHDRQRLVQQSVQFNQLAKRIGKDVSHTCAKMEKLTELAKKNSLFEERGGEIEELSNIIRQDIAGLNKQIAVLHEYKKSRFGASENSKDQGEGHSKLVVVGLQTKLASVTKTFQNVLEMRTENLKKQKNRREVFSRTQQVPAAMPASSSSGYMNLLLTQGENNAASNSVSLDMDQLQAQNQMTMMNDGMSSYAQQRSSAMAQIEENISALGSIFSQLASLVSEQGEMITRIDANVEETSMNVESAHVELLRYFNSISKNRWLMLKIFGVLMIFFVVFVVFLT
uniref:t-SNARE coiled-coil homology domain-containing protein n=1 Tax=Steinernema glaseri TaxID=37863 RepID=A0A1I7Y8R2_9BILA